MDAPEVLSSFLLSCITVHISVLDLDPDRGDKLTRTIF